MNIKNIVLMLAFSCLASGLQAQKVYLWLDAGVKGSYGPNMMVNADILNGTNYTPKLNGSYAFGAKFGVNFGEYYAITFDGMYSQFKQQFTYKPDASTSTLAINEYRWSAIDFYPLFRYNRTINYIELGPRISWLRDAKQANNTSSFTDVTGDFNDVNYSAVLGFGWYAAGDDSFTAIIGVRLAYDVSNFVSEQGIQNNQVDLGLVDGDATTNPAFVQLVFELNWGLGYYARTVCGGRARFFRF
jgi:hypothetical protein